MIDNNPSQWRLGGKTNIKFNSELFSSPQKQNHTQSKCMCEKYVRKIIYFEDVYQALPHCALPFIKLRKAQSNLNQIKLYVMNTDIHLAEPQHILHDFLLTAKCFQKSLQLFVYNSKSKNELSHCFFVSAKMTFRSKHAAAPFFPSSTSAFCVSWFPLLK